MIVNKKLDRFKQWAGERMGGEVKTAVSEDIKALEVEMNMRHDGTERMHRSMTAYVKAISKRNEGDDKEKTLPIARLGSSMVNHGEEFDSNSEYGQCLSRLGRSQERLARAQENFIAQATASWLESLERSLAQMKEYQTARKKLESRRLAYDTSLTKMQKAKREDFRVEEELRTQKVKYEEATDDLYRRMQDIKDAEIENTADLTAFLDAQLEYHERCREILLQARSDWPAGMSQSQTPGRRTGRARSNTALSYQERYEPLHEEPRPTPSESRPVIRSRQPSSHHAGSPVREAYPAENGTNGYQQRPVYNRAPTFEGPSQLRQDQTMVPTPLYRATSDFALRRTTSQIRSRPTSTWRDSYADPSSDDVGPFGGPSPDRSYGETFGSASSSTSYGDSSMLSRTTSATTLNSVNLAKKAPPPPPPSRAKKPPPPPVKRPSIGV